MTLLLLALAGATPPTISQTFPTPDGFTDVSGGDFGRWLGERPLRSENEPVRTHDGRTVGHDAWVVDLPMVRGDLQQCADSLLRLRGEWLRSNGQPVMFHATSGDPMPWHRFRDGETPVERGGRIAWVTGSSGKWDDYLARLFMWAGTHSLQTLDSVPTDSPHPGDILVEGGFPGHAVILLAVAVRGSETRVLVGEGYMPAQSFHVELGPEEGWWRWHDGLDLGHWSFDASDLRRFK
jgi:hypothetical protein